MLFKKEHENDQNFWISYADLMAGLLFIFILVIGAIVVKTVLISSDLQAIRTDLQKEKDALKMSEKRLSEKKDKVRKLIQKLLASKEENARLSMRLSLLKTQIDDLNNEINVLHTNIDEKASKLSLTQTELDEIKALLLDSQHEVVHLKNDLNTSKQLIEQKDISLHLKDEELAQLEKALLLNKRAYQKVVEDLNITKTKIRNLTGIKVKVVQRLKQKLGHSVQIDPKSGALRFSSNILFNQGKSTLKPAAKKQLRTDLSRYIDTLLNDKQISKYIDTIVIEGHTNSDGSYMYNLYLSQQRALSVMEFLFKEYPHKRKLFRKYITASGRSFAEPIYDKYGKEDKDKSRRIEIKFYIKSNEAIKELQNFIGN